MDHKIFFRIIFSVVSLFPFCSLSMENGAQNEEVSNSLRHFDRGFYCIEKIFRGDPLEKQSVEDEKVEDTQDLTSETSSSDDDGLERSMRDAQKTGCFEPFAQLSERIKILLRKKK